MNRRITFVILLLCLVVVGRFTFAPQRGLASTDRDWPAPGGSRLAETTTAHAGGPMFLGTGLFVRGDAAFNLDREGLARHKHRILFASTVLNLAEIGLDVPRFHFPHEPARLFPGQIDDEDVHWMPWASLNRGSPRGFTVASATPSRFIPGDRIGDPASLPPMHIPEWTQLAHADVPIDPTSPRPFNQPYVPSEPAEYAPIVVSPVTAPPTALPPLAPPVSLPYEFVGPVRIPGDPPVPEPATTLSGLMILAWMLRRARD